VVSPWKYHVSGKVLTHHQDAESLRGQLDAALARELSWLAELYEAKKKLAQLTGENFLPIRKREK